MVVATKDGLAIALDATDGSEKWRADIAGESVSRPLVADDTVMVQTIDNRLQALSLFDGRPRWSIQRDAPALTMRGSASPVAVGGTALIPFPFKVASLYIIGDVLKEANLVGNANTNATK